MNPAIACLDLSVNLSPGKGKNRLVLNKLNATFPVGRVSIVTGTIGAGKTTLLNTLAGLRRPTSGEVAIDGKAVSRWIGVHRDRWRRQAGIIFQHDHLMGDLTVLENVMLPLIPLGLSLSECRRRAMRSLEKVTLSNRAGSMVNTLSGGEKQKSAIARALVNRPVWIFADEPTAHQDADNAQQVMDLLSQCAQKGSAVIVATHETEMPGFSIDAIRYRLAGGTLNPTVL